MKNTPLPRLDINHALREKLEGYCRIQKGEIWQDTLKGHKIACVDATNFSKVLEMMRQERAHLAVHDPPYNIIAFEKRKVEDYVSWSQKWIQNTWKVLHQHAALYVWMGALQNHHFSPLPEFMLMMQKTPFRSRSLITMRNQRGYGTQKNWMSVRQELLYYTKGSPRFEVQYTEIPKILDGYYKTINKRRVNNSERSTSKTIRPGNVWVDVQQVFYRMQENVSGCYAQKPLKAIERILLASSRAGELVIDFFGHSGTTLIAAERTQRICYILDTDPLYCEMMRRRLEHFRNTRETGWQNGHAFEKEDYEEI